MTLEDTLAVIKYVVATDETEAGGLLHRGVGSRLAAGKEMNNSKWEREQTNHQMG